MRRRILLALVLTLLSVMTATHAAPPDVRQAPSLTPSNRPGPSPEEVAQALALVNAFIDCVNREDFEKAFTYVRGIDDPKVTDIAFRNRVHELIADRAFRELSTCDANLETIGTAIDAYGRANGWKLPKTLDALAHSAYLSELPVCPAGGHYIYTDDDRDPRIVCSRDAHARIGVKGDFPALSLRGGRSLGGQRLNFDQNLDFKVSGYTVTVAAYQPDFITLWIAIEEQSSMRGEPTRARTGWFGMSRRNGEWKIDLFLSNQDMNGMFDLEAWLENTAICKQVLYYVLLTLPGQRPPEAERTRAELLLKVCESNLRNLAVLVEKISLTRNGRYPLTVSLATLLRQVHNTLQRCPAGGTYRYQADSDGDGDTYRIYCEGHAHAAAGVPANQPSVDPVMGVVRQRSLSSP